MFLKVVFGYVRGLGLTLCYILYLKPIFIFQTHLTSSVGYYESAQ